MKSTWALLQPGCERGNGGIRGLEVMVEKEGPCTLSVHVLVRQLVQVFPSAPWAWVRRMSAEGGGLKSQQWGH